MVMMRGNEKAESARAEAAAWLARLESGSDGQENQAFRAWLDEKDVHRAAFAEAKDVWDMLPRAAAAMPSPERAASGSYKSNLGIRFAIAASLLAMIGFGVFKGLQPTPLTYATATGQQQSVSLDDGTRITLNTNTSVTILYDRTQRLVRLDHGEVIFEVYKEPGRPFIVTDGIREVRALGTTFVVKEDDERVAVTLIEGRVEVSRNANGAHQRVAVLRPGDRLNLAGRAGALIDRPSLDAIMAWRNGKLMFDDASLLEAANEMNRYAVGPQLVLSPNVAGLRISGVFTIGDPFGFSASVAALHHLRIKRKGKEIHLLPAAPSGASRT
jgi:transmembrane sensor